MTTLIPQQRQSMLFQKFSTEVRPSTMVRRDERIPSMRFEEIVESEEEDNQLPERTPPEGRSPFAVAFESPFAERRPASPQNLSPTNTRKLPVPRLCHGFLDHNSLRQAPAKFRVLSPDRHAIGSAFLNLENNGPTSPSTAAPSRPVSCKTIEAIYLKTKAAKKTVRILEYAALCNGGTTDFFQSQKSLIKILLLPSIASINDVHKWSKTACKETSPFYKKTEEGVRRFLKELPFYGFGKEELFLARNFKAKCPYNRLVETLLRDNCNKFGVVGKKEFAYSVDYWVKQYCKPPFCYAKALHSLAATVFTRYYNTYYLKKGTASTARYVAVSCADKDCGSNGLKMVACIGEIMYATSQNNKLLYENHKEKYYEEYEYYGGGEGEE